MRSRFKQAKKEKLILENPLDDNDPPKGKVDGRERAVLTDQEYYAYMMFQNPLEHLQLATFERQVMGSLIRMHGGLRTRDAHDSQWTDYDLSNDGAFTWGRARRNKTKRPQLIRVPEQLRKILKLWWTLKGKPTSGYLFPPLRGKNAGKNALRHSKRKVSHAKGLRRDLQMAFEAFRKANTNMQAEVLEQYAPAKDGQRWTELFKETEFTKPVDFHSWRRAFTQALGNAGVNEQTAMALTGHSSSAVHALYNRNSAKTYVIPEAALPEINVRLLTAPKISGAPNDPNTENLVDAIATNSNRLPGRIGVRGVHPGGVSIPENRPRGGYNETARDEFQGDRGRVGR